MQVTIKTKIILLFILIIVIFAACLHLYPKIRLSKYDYIELTIENRIKTINISDYKIKAEFSGGFSKAILEGVIVSEGKEKTDIIFYPDSNSFRFKDGRIRYRICSEKYVAYE